ncbi:MAG TPA: hypothetical protein PKY82_26620 [Pyrinomonadaceae bacterium]|nr:hypothetical protein [Pyrinomonadaceae bacterium]
MKTTNIGLLRFMKMSDKILIPKSDLSNAKGFINILPKPHIRRVRSFCRLSDRWNLRCKPNITPTAKIDF